MDKQQELFERLKALMGDMKFTKELQWRNVYWSLLLFGGLTALYLGMPHLRCLDPLLAWSARCFGLAATVSAAIFLVRFQCHHANALRAYRLRMETIETMFRRKLENEIEDKIAELRDRKDAHYLKRRGRYDREYKGASIVTICVAAMVAAAAILRDLILILAQ